MSRRIIVLPDGSWELVTEDTKVVEVTERAFERLIYENSADSLTPEDILDGETLLNLWEKT